MINRKILQKYRETAHRTLNILNEIERGEKSTTEIARRTRSSRQLVNHYIVMITGDKEVEK